MYTREISRRLANSSRIKYLQVARKYRDPQTQTPRDEVLLHLGREDKLDKDELRRLVRSLNRFLEPVDQAAVEADLKGLGADLALQRSLSYGGAYLPDQLRRRLGLDDALREPLMERSLRHDIERILLAFVANRALAPRSKLGLERWVGRHAAIDGLDEVPVQALYLAVDLPLSTVRSSRNGSSPPPPAS